MGGVTRTHAPNGGFAGAYEEAYRAYAKLFQSLKPFFGADGDAGRAPGLPQDGGE